jgi:SAM-dependent methyltransferase
MLAFLRLFTRFSRWFRGFLKSHISVVDSDFTIASKAPGRPSLGSVAELPGKEPKYLYSEIHRLCHVEGNYPQGWQLRVNCPCCGNHRLTPAFTKLGMRHDRCTECDYVCVNPYPPADFLSLLYAGSIYTQIREHYELPLAREGGLGSAYSAPPELLDMLIACGTKGREKGSWLDVGGGIGVFANLVAQREPGWNVSLNEMNPRSVEIAHELFSLNVLTGDVAKLSAEGKKFDVISLIAVLEHVVDPVDFIEGYVSLLKPGGLLITVVPHFTALNVHVSKASNGNVIPPFHLSLFGKSNLKQMFERTGLFSSLDTMQSGEPSFSLIDHVEHWQYWDSLLPDGENPSFRSVRVADYPADANAAINKLDSVVTATKDYFAEHDGRVHLALLATKH